MTETTEASLHRTPLHDQHDALGAKLIEFGGWLMPVQYAGIIEEHRAVRERAGLFDLSHMGELFVEGPDAGAALAYALVERLAGFRAVLDDRSLATALCAVQGPRSVDIVGPLTDVDLGALRYYAIGEGHVAGIPALVARTGYTGEDGFEIFVDNARALELWDALTAAGEPHGLAPVGLGARDTLRLEAGMPLYGNDLDRSTNPYEAGLGRVVKLDKPGDFVGRAALEKVAREGPARKLVGLVMEGRGIARHGYAVYRDERRTGEVTSGTQSPSLGRAIAMAYVGPADAESGTILDVEIREQRVPAKVVDLPFYRRPRTDG